MPLRRFLKWVSQIFGRKKAFKLAVYGAPNGGKTSLANRISLEWTGKEIGRASEIPHETRKVSVMREVEVRANGKTLTFDLIDVPGISAKDDLTGKHLDAFHKYMSKSDAKVRMHEAIEGVKQAVKILGEIDSAILVLDSADDPYNPINSLIIGALEANDVPFIIVANKTDLKQSDMALIRAVYSDYTIVPLSVEKDKNIDALYHALADHHK